MKSIIPLLSLFLAPSTANFFITKEEFYQDDFIDDYHDACGKDARPLIATLETLDLIFDIMDDEKLDSAWVGGWYEPLIEEPHRANLGRNAVTINPNDRPHNKFPVLCEELFGDDDKPKSKRQSKSKRKKSSSSKTKKNSKKKDYYCDKKGKKCKTYFDY